MNQVCRLLAVIDHLRAGPTTVTRICDETGTSEQSARFLIAELHRAGRIMMLGTCPPNGKRGVRAMRYAWVSER